MTPALEAAEVDALRVIFTPLVRVGREAADEVVTVGLAGFDVGEPDWFSAPLDAPAWTQVVAYDGVVPVATGFEPAYGVVQWRPR